MRKLATRKSTNRHGSCVDPLLHQRANGKERCAVMWPVVWTAMRTYAPYVTFPVAFVVGAVGYHLEWFIRGTPKPREEEKSILELREERKLQEQVGMDSTQVLSLKEKLEFAPKAALNRNRPEKS
ncbi:small integral membrane protein 12 isoform X1 [Thunnus albacares]|uniref:small integral membrane protein 12 isoform X1 n=2 Tax=Thunnus maccoyii TaxID=8240 RepID=UPI001C4BF7B4|nr:small integral membrane protein 12 isoform X1 [Thunnus maccoyii]XP_044192417.1 small integral membrane protein 12 isoform X1 [Thunnus albacares]